MNPKIDISGQSMQEILSYTSSTSGFRVTERWFSDDQSLLSIGIANIHALVPDIEANKKKIIHAIEIFKEMKVNLAIFPEFCLSGYFWEDETACRRYIDRAVIENHSQWIDGTLRTYLDDTLKGIILNSLRKGNSGKYNNSTYYINRDDDFNYALDFNAIYRPVDCKRVFT